MKKQGFASLSIKRRKEIASLGGKTSHARGKAHKWTSEEASAAGMKASLNRWKKDI